MGLAGEQLRQGRGVGFGERVHTLTADPNAVDGLHGDRDRGDPLKRGGLGDLIAGPLFRAVTHSQDCHQRRNTDDHPEGEEERP